jgi:hypothetical protein
MRRLARRFFKLVDFAYPQAPAGEISQWREKGLAASPGLAF